MSYDIRFGVKVADTDLIAVIGEPEYSSPTYNIGTIFRKSTGWDFEQSEWYRVSEVLPNIEQGIRELRFHPGKYKKYEPANGWGTVGTALEVLESIIKWLTGDWERGWNTEIPIEQIWICW